MADSAEMSVSNLPFKEGDYIQYGRFKNKAGKLSKIWVDDKGVIKIEITPVPKGRKKVRTMGLFHIRKMDETALAKARAAEAEEAKKNALKNARIVDRYMSAMSAPVGMPRAERGRSIWASACGKYRIQDLGAGQDRFQVQFKVGRSWYDDQAWPDLKVALREIRAGEDPDAQ